LESREVDEGEKEEGKEGEGCALVPVALPFTVAGNLPWMKDHPSGPPQATISGPCWMRGLGKREGLRKMRVEATAT
jgi:hypothetical protein